MQFTKEHNDFLLFRYRWISGCCTPPDMILLDKNTGEEIERISNEKLIWYEWEEDYIIYFSDSLYNTITYFDLSNNTKRETKLPPNRGISTLNIIIENYPYDIFQRLPKVENNYLLLEYDYQHPKFKDSLMTDVIQIKKP